MDVRLVECTTAASPSRLPGLDWAVNPYRGCSHACAYCYAQDVTRFEMRVPWGSVVEVKANIVQRLKKELSRRSDGVFGVGTVTDPYQALEGEYELTRGCLSLLKRHNAQASILTKSDLVLRDIAILEDWPGVEVGVSVGTSDGAAASIVEPGAPSPEVRFEALGRLAASDISVFLMAAPIIPGVSDSDESLRSLVDLAGSSGVKRIIWDGFNPKPIAKGRLERALAEAGLVRKDRVGRGTAADVRARLSDECRRLGISLVDAF
jgi:DNA repair photolyase